MKKIIRTVYVLLVAGTLGLTGISAASAADRSYLNQANITHPGAKTYYTAIYSHVGGPITQAWTYTNINCAANMNFSLRFANSGYTTATNTVTFSNPGTARANYTRGVSYNSNMLAGNYQLNAQSTAKVNIGCAESKTIYWEGYTTTQG